MRKVRRIGSFKSKNIQHNGQKKIVKRTNNDVQNTTQKTKDTATTKNPLKTGGVQEQGRKTPVDCITIVYTHIYIVCKLTRNVHFIIVRTIERCGYTMKLRLYTHIYPPVAKVKMYMYIIGKYVNFLNLNFEILRNVKALLSNTINF